MDKVTALLNNSVAVGIIALLLGMWIGGEVFDGGRYEKGMHKMSDGRMMKDSNKDTDMRGMMHGMMAGLEGKTGDAFDKAFLEEMIVHHEGAVQMAKALLNNQSKHPELQKLGNDIITAQTGEIELMKGWLNSWFGN